MNKKEAKEALQDWFDKQRIPATVDQKDIAKAKDAIDAIKAEHTPVVFPQKVGEQWDKLVRREKDSRESTKVDKTLHYLSHDLGYNVPIDDSTLLFNWWSSTPESYSALINASKYGWVPKSEKLYRVRVYGIDLPGLLYRKRDDGTITFVQGGYGLRETEFTMGEIKQRHLEHCEREEVTDDENN